MTVDASRSCLGLATCVGSATRQIVDARVLLTATAPPALPGGSMSGGSLAPSRSDHGFIALSQPPAARVGRWPRGSQLTGDRGSDDIGWLAAASKLAIAGAQP